MKTVKKSTSWKLEKEEEKITSSASKALFSPVIFNIYLYIYTSTSNMRDDIPDESLLINQHK